MVFRFLWLLVLIPSCAFSQVLIFPDAEDWNTVKEGQTLSFQVKVNDAAVPRFSIEGTNGYGIQFDTLGNFSWKPSFDLADRLEKQKEISLIFQAEWKDGRKVRTTMNFKVLHQNRAPEVDELPSFYVKQATLNQYQISSDYVRDPDGDPLVFKVSPSQLPEGMSLSSSGLLSWKPSRNQFNSLRQTPMTIEFTAQDQPEKAEATGKIKVAQTQLDLPPEILLVPGDTSFTIKENERINFKIYVSDPNGDDDVLNVGFLCSDERVPITSLKANTNVQYEFTWSPGYQFTDDAEKIRNVEIIFFAVDKSNNRVQRKVKVKVVDAENLEEKDKLLYMKYSATLTQAKALLELLKEKHKQLEKDYKQAKKGKKNRSIFGASIGAGSAVSSAVVTSPDNLKAITVIGGSTTATLGTLEATEVIGKSKNDIMDLIKTETELRNQLQLEGDIFARKYALKSNRRSIEFDNDRDKFLPILNHQKLATLELDASKPLATKYDVKEMKKTFADFSEE
jgi:PIN domain nuclease of toxin-antitoxin system